MRSIDLMIEYAYARSSSPNYLGQKGKLS
jgi:hypothetical protein